MTVSWLNFENSVYAVCTVGTACFRAVVAPSLFLVHVHDQERRPPRPSGKYITAVNFFHYHAISLTSRIDHQHLDGAEAFTLSVSRPTCRINCTGTASDSRKSNLTKLFARAMLHPGSEDPTYPLQSSEYSLSDEYDIVDEVMFVFEYWTGIDSRYADICCWCTVSCVCTGASKARSDSDEKSVMDSMVLVIDVAVRAADDGRTLAVAESSSGCCAVSR